MRLSTFGSTEHVVSRSPLSPPWDLCRQLLVDPLIRTVFTLTPAILSASAGAAEHDKYDGATVAAIYYEVRSDCRMRETVDGRQLTDEEAYKQCLILDALGEQLKAHGYCWDQGEQEWTFCGASQ